MKDLLSYGTDTTVNTTSDTTVRLNTIFKVEAYLQHYDLSFITLY